MAQVDASIQNKFNKPNMIYKVTKDYDLGGNTLTIPTDCILDFQGGSFSNGTIVGDNTKIDAEVNQIFNDITISGNWNIDNIYDTWFNYNASTGSDNTSVIRSILSLTNDNVKSTVYFSKERTYYVSLPSGELRIFSPTSNTTIVLNGSIILNGTSSTNYYIFIVQGKTNIVFKGFGSIIGDVSTHIGDTGEWGFGIYIANSNNITIEDLTINECWGDAIYVGTESSTVFTSDYINLKNVKCLRNRRQGLSIISAAYMNVVGCVFAHTGLIKYTSPGAGIDIEPNNPSIEYLKDIFIDRCTFENNIGGGTLIANVTSGIAARTNIKISNCSYISNDARFGDATNTVFDNCTFVKPILVNDTIQSNIRIMNSKFSGLEYLSSIPFTPNFRFDNCIYSTPTLEYVTDRYINISATDVAKITLPVNASGLLELSFVGNYNSKRLAVANRTIFNLNKLSETIYIANIANVELFAPSNKSISYAELQETVLFSEPVVTDNQVSIYVKWATGQSNIAGTIGIRPLIKYNTIDKTINWEDIIITSVDSAIVDTLSFPINISNNIADITEREFLYNLNTGKIFYDITKDTPMIKAVSTIKELSTIDHPVGSYLTANRPTVGEGCIIYDSTLKKCILYNNTVWVNLDGSTL